MQIDMKLGVVTQEKVSFREWMREEEVYQRLGGWLGMDLGRQGVPIYN